MVLARREGEHVPPVHERENRDLRSGHAFLDDDPLAGVAENALDHDAIDGAEPFVERIRQDDALALREPGGFDDLRLIACAEVLLRKLRILEDAPVGGWQQPAADDLFRPCLVGLELRGVARRAEDAAAGGGQFVGPALGERILRPDDDQPDVVPLAVLREPVDLARRDRDVDRVAQRREARVLRVRDVERAEPRRLRDSMRDRVLATARRR